MEDATKALIMAGTVLIALLVISLGVYLFNTYSEFAYQNQEKQAIQEKRQFNTKFEKYVETELTLQDVVTITNMAKEYNEKYKDAGNSISVIVNGINWTNYTNEELIEKLIDAVEKNDSTKYIIESYNDIQYDSNGIISGVHIKTIEMVKLNYRF